MKTTAPLLEVKGVTLQYKTPDHLVTATYRIDFEVFRGGEIHPAWTVGLRKIDPAEGGRRLHDADRRRNPAQGKPDQASGSGSHDGVPGVRPAAAVEDGQAECDVSARIGQPHVGARGGRTRDALHQQGQSREFRRRLSAHAVRRHEAARGDRARHGDGAGYPADGRAVRRTRRADAPQDAGRIADACGTRRASRCCS